MSAAPASGLTEWCPQCYRDRPIELFISANGSRFLVQCSDCRARYGKWDSLSPEEKRARKKPRKVAGDGYHVAFILESHNRKTGPIPVSTTDMASCPVACVFRGNGCYAEHGKVGWFWSRVGGDRGVPWSDFCLEVAKLPMGQLWRHNEAGDLPGVGDELDTTALWQLVNANRGRRGFTFTHMPLTTVNDQLAVSNANRDGFTINLSANSLEHADQLANLGIGPVVVVLPHDAPADLQTPEGRDVILCLNVTKGLTCEQCGLCAVAKRKSIVGFPAHGTALKMVSDLVKLRRKEPAHA